jgi:hypothetical protein
MAGERALLHRWRVAVWLLVGGVFWLSVWSAKVRETGDVDWKTWFANMAPEFLGAAAIGLFLQWFLRDDDRKKYVNAMRSIRRAIRKQNLATEQVQKLMEDVVPAVSVLYFATSQPAQDYEGERITERPTNCGTCASKGEPVKGGRCTRCFDIVDSWNP